MHPSQKKKTGMNYLKMCGMCVINTFLIYIPMSEKKDKKLNSDKFFTLSRRGRLSIERILSRRNLWIISISLLGIILVFLLLSVVTNTLQGIEDDKFEQLIINLRKANVITKPMEGSLRANITIGNMSAHGDKKFDDISDKEIKEYLNFIRDKVLNL